MRNRRFRRLKRVLDRRQPDLTVLMEGVHKPHNFSAILRNCDAVGVLEAHVVPPDEGLDLDETVSASASKWLDVRRHASIGEAADVLASGGFRLVAAHPSPEAEGYRSVDFTEPTAIVVGTELYGLTPEALERVDVVAAIPMVGMVRSLNVSVATAILLFEAFRQRDDAGMYDEPRLDGDRYRRLLFEWAYPRVARILRDRGEPYPPLGDSGEILASSR